MRAWSVGGVRHGVRVPGRRGLSCVRAGVVRACVQVVAMKGTRRCKCCSCGWSARAPCLDLEGRRRNPSRHCQHNRILYSRQLVWRKLARGWVRGRMSANCPSARVLGLPKEILAGLGRKVLPCGLGSPAQSCHSSTSHAVRGVHARDEPRRQKRPTTAHRSRRAHHGCPFLHISQVPPTTPQAARACHPLHACRVPTRLVRTHQAVSPRVCVHSCMRLHMRAQTGHGMPAVPGRHHHQTLGS